jgi:hypothetical protein
LRHRAVRVWMMAGAIVVGVFGQGIPAVAVPTATGLPVLVVMRDQPSVGRTSVGGDSAAAVRRHHEISAAQAPLLSELSRSHATRLRTFDLVNAVSASVSPAEAARLAGDPSVAAVVPDTTFRIQPPTSGNASTGFVGPKASGSTTAPASEVCAPPGSTLLEPEALGLTHTASDDPKAKTAQALGINGAGVKVAFMADSIDVDNRDFIRPDGSHVFVDYQNFTEDPENSVSSGEEAFIDASSVAAQGAMVHDVRNFGAVPQSAPCDIRILGAAPGASLVGLRIFGADHFTTVSDFVSAIQYAVTVDHVNVLNESESVTPIPDTAADLWRMANQAAVNAGVTVTVSSGDAGITGGPESPATEPGVISVGASTAFRWLKQTGWGGGRQFGPNGWLNDNISSLSSGGVGQDGRTYDLVAPGDQAFAPCTPDLTRFSDCTTLTGAPSDVTRSDGTSEAAPLTAAAAALVIQAYGRTHAGAAPTPALIKQILASTADDLTEPSEEQGAGLLDTYKAVQAAESVASPATATGDTLLVDKGQLDASGLPGTTAEWHLKVTNTGADTQHVKLSGRGFGAATGERTGSVVLSDSASPQFVDWTGATDNVEQLPFTVAPGAQRLSASIAYQGTPPGSRSNAVWLALVDPLGRFAAYSLPQGVSNFGNADVRLPTAGRWIAEIFSRTSQDGGVTGKVLFSATTQHTVGMGTVSPSALTLAPGASRTVTVTAPVPDNPGDTTAAVVLDAGAAGRTSVPVVLRSLIDPASGGRFTGILTGGNGRRPNVGQITTYQFDVPAGRREVSAGVDLTNDPGDTVVAYLVNPQGLTMATGVNNVATEFHPATQTGKGQQVTQTDLSAIAPAPGRWSLTIDIPGAIAGDEVSQTFIGRIGFDTEDVHTSGLPNSAGTVLPVGRQVTVPVTVHNTGSAPQNYFVDARLTGTTTVSLAVNGLATVPLPTPFTAVPGVWLVPAETTGLRLVAQGTEPVAFDFGPTSGDPQIGSQVTGNAAVGTVSGDPLPSGIWGIDVGPLLTKPDPDGTAEGSVTMSATATTRPFDPAVTSQVTDLWTSSVHPADSLTLVTVQPGQSTTIPVTITPSGAKGAVVSGTLFVDALVVGDAGVLSGTGQTNLGPLQANANEMAAIPYRYTIG